MANDDANVTAPNENFASESRISLKNDGEDLPKDIVTDDHGHLRQSGWLATSALIIADIVGTGLLSLPGAFAQLGMAVGIVALIACYPLNFFTGYQLNRVHLKHRSAVTFGDVGNHLFGKVGGFLCYFALYFNLLLLLGDYLITLSKSIQGILWHVNLCRPMAGVYAAILLLPSNQFRTLNGLKELAAMSFATVCIVLVIYVGTVLNKHSEGEQCVSATVKPASGLMPVAGAISKFIFAFSGQQIYLEMQAEMKEPEKFTKSMNFAFPILGSVYLGLALVSVVCCGDHTPSYILDALGYDWTRTVANVLMCAHMIVSYTISQNVLSRAVARFAIPHALTPGASGHITWFMLSTFLMFIGYICANLIPLFDDFVGLMGSLLSTQMSFSIPPALYLGARHHYGNMVPEKFDKFMLPMSIFCLAVAAFFTITGTIDAMKNIIEDSKDIGKPFGCHCISEACAARDGLL